MTIYYVYAYISKHGLPYYIGKGSNGRAFGKHSNINIPNNKSKIVFLEINLTEIGAFALERRYIRWYGRKDIGTGVLMNKTDGGEGPAGFRHTKEAKQKIAEAGKRQIFTDERCKKISKANTGKIRSQETKDKLKEAWTKRPPHSAETRAKMSASLMGIKRAPRTAEHRRKLGEAARKGKGRPKPPRSAEHIANWKASRMLNRK